ncbi:ATP-binding protein [Clavibacter michiganensis]|uniref:ATP-binding protein n=1 Tax=Clavibacter michiganensis TaxID=28447 RepID=UPI00068EE2E2|nr:ATP-binding protein [Clavibacter michiganensis]
MVRTLTVIGPLLALLSLPALVVEDAAGAVAPPAMAVALCLATLMIAAVPASLVPRGLPAYGCLRLSALLYAALIVLEPLRIADAMLPDAAPWLVALSCIGFSCIALGVQDPLRAGAVCWACVALVAAIYAGRLPTGELVVQALGLAGIAAALVLGVRALRVRASRADAAERRARELFESSRRGAALAAERVRTDALLHDTVLAALLSAAGQDAPDRVARMARSALDIVTGTAGGPDARSRTVLFGDAVAAAEREIAPLEGLARLDLARAASVELPSAVADALVAAMVQALSNSVTHAGPTTVRTATAAPSPGGGVRIRVRDDGSGFDPARVGPDQLGVRVSIVERMRQVGGDAEVRSVPGRGTTVVLRWQPDDDHDAPTEAPGDGTRMGLIPRRALRATMTALVLAAIVLATVEAALVFQAMGPVIAAVLGMAALPALVRGARTGRMRTGTAWALTAVGGVICATATIGLDADEVDSVTISWLTCGILAACVMVWMAGHRLPPLVATGFLVAAIAVWGDAADVVRLGLAAEIVLVAAGLLMHRALRDVSEATRRAAADERETLLWQADLDAYQLERQDRLRVAAGEVAPVLRRIVASGGALDAASRAECGVLEQTLRDEIRGRRLLNDGLRRVIRAHRRRGAQVQVLDDGGLDDLAPDALDALLDDVAELVRPLRSSRIVVRTSDPLSGAAVTIVASSPDEIAAALGLDADEEVELWTSIPRPAVEASAIPAPARGTSARVGRRRATPGARPR